MVWRDRSVHRAVSLGGTVADVRGGTGGIGRFLIRESSTRPRTLIACRALGTRGGARRGIALRGRRWFSFRSVSSRRLHSTPRALLDALFPSHRRDREALKALDDAAMPPVLLFSSPPLFTVLLPNSCACCRFVDRARLRGLMGS